MHVFVPSLCHCLLPSPCHCGSILLCFQASHKQLLAKAVDAPPSDDEPVVHEEEEVIEESDEEVIGFSKPVKQEPDPKRRRRTKGPEEPTSSAARSVRSSGAAPASKRKPSADLTEAIKNAEACIAAMHTFSPLAFWQGTLKAKDVEKRVQLAFDTFSALEELIDSSCSAEIQAWPKKLEDEAGRISDWMEMLAPLRNSDMCLQKLRSMDKEEVKKLGACIPPDCLHSVLHDLGRKLWEDRSGDPTKHDQTIEN